MSKSTNIYKSLSSTFDVPDVVDVTPKSENAISTEIVIPEDKTLDSDATAVRDTLYKLLTAGAEAFDDLKRIAVAEESPRSFEVLNGMLGNLSDIALKLIEVQDKVGKIKRADQKGEEQTGGTTNITNYNTAFVGTTADLQDVIKRLSMEDNDNE